MAKKNCIATCKNGHEYHISCDICPNCHDEWLDFHRGRIEHHLKRITHHERGKTTREALKIAEMIDGPTAVVLKS